MVYVVLVIVGLVAAGAGYWFWDLRRTNAEIMRVFQEGVDIRAVVVQINQTAYDPENKALLDPGALLLITFDRTIPDEVAFLQGPAKQMQRLKGAQPADPDARLLADLINDERLYEGRRVQIPPKFTGGKVVYCTWLSVSKAGLPDGYLQEPFIKCKAIPGEKGILAQIDRSAEQAAS
jgi:hypothetical protein